MPAGTIHYDGLLTPQPKPQPSQTAAAEVEIAARGLIALPPPDPKPSPAEAEEHSEEGRSLVTLARMRGSLAQSCEDFKARCNV
jgi:hypothetical protein